MSSSSGRKIFVIKHKTKPPRIKVETPPVILTPSKICERIKKEKALTPVFLSKDLMDS